MHHSEARRQIEIVEEEIKRRIAIGSRASTQRIIKEFERVRIIHKFQILPDKHDKHINYFIHLIIFSCKAI